MPEAQLKPVLNRDQLSATAHFWLPKVGWEKQANGWLIPGMIIVMPLIHSTWRDNLNIAKQALEWVCTQLDEDDHLMARAPLEQWRDRLANFPRAAFSSCETALYDLAVACGMPPVDAYDEETDDDSEGTD